MVQLPVTKYGILNGKTWKREMQITASSEREAMEKFCKAKNWETAIHEEKGAVWIEKDGVRYDAIPSEIVQIF